jgi:hypothetical protein
MVRQMSSKTMAVVCSLLTAFVCSATLSSQPTPASALPAATEFPVVMRQNVAAGKTPVGTKVEAKLVIATLVNGMVIPKDAVLSGEVIESVAKSGNDPSRLALRIDSAQWKNGSVPIKVYLTPWYYPAQTIQPQNLSYGPTDAEHTPRNWNGDGPYYNPNSPVYQPLPGSDLGKKPNTAATPDHRILMKNVECLRSSDGSVILTSAHSNVKIDKSTTYVLATNDLLPTNK